MDVGTINATNIDVAQYSARNKNVAGAQSAYKASAATAEQAVSTSTGAAYDLKISDAAKQVAAQKQTETAEETTTKRKGLSADEVRYLKESAAAQEQTMLNMMIQALTDSNSKLEGWLNNGVGKLRFGDTLINASRFGMPQVATNPEDAAKAIGKGGDWSVDAVAGRIYDLATAIAGNDPQKLEEMRGAIEQGFKEAGLSWKNATGSSSMPDITKNTYNEIMHRLDTYMAKLTNTNYTATAANSFTD